MSNLAVQLKKFKIKFMKKYCPWPWPLSQDGLELQLSLLAGPGPGAGDCPHSAPPRSETWDSSSVVRGPKHSHRFVLLRSTNSLFFRTQVLNNLRNKDHAEIQCSFPVPHQSPCARHTAHTCSGDPRNDKNKDFVFFSRLWIYRSAINEIEIVNWSWFTLGFGNLEIHFSTSLS